MDADSAIVPANPPQITIPVGDSAGIGGLTIAPPTFLERWGVVFVSVGGVWMLVVCLVMLGYFLAHLSMAPAQPAGMPASDYKAVLDAHKLATDQFRDSVTFVFDLMVTKTVLPILTLLLGYLFGSKKS